MRRATPRHGPRPGMRARGHFGETVAAEYLRAHGFRIVARNLHLRHSEIDLIALEGDTLCFIEVRLRSTRRYGSPEESVDARKRRRLTRAARQVLASRDLPHFEGVRFDVLGIEPGPRGLIVRLLRDAFRPGD